MEVQDAPVDILLIEDNRDIAALVVELLCLAGYRVEASLDGSRLDDVIAAPPRLILLDLMLPGMNGAEICRHIRAASGTTRVPIFIITAAAPALIEKLTRGCAYDGLLRKPFDIDELLAVAAHYVRGEATWQRTLAVPGAADAVKPHDLKERARY